MKKIKNFYILFILNIIVSINLLANSNINREFFYQNKDTIYYFTGEFRVHKIKNVHNAYLIFISNSTIDQNYLLISPKQNIRLNEKLKEGKTYIMQIVYLYPKEKYVKYFISHFPFYFKLLGKVIKISFHNQLGTIVISPNVYDKYYRGDNFLDPEVFKELNKKSNSDE